MQRKGLVVINVHKENLWELYQFSAISSPFRKQPKGKYQDRVQVEDYRVTTVRLGTLEIQCVSLVANLQELDIINLICGGNTLAQQLS